MLTPLRTPQHVIDNISEATSQFVITKRPYYDYIFKREVSEVQFELPGRFLMGAREEPGRLAQNCRQKKRIECTITVMQRSTLQAKRRRRALTDKITSIVALR